MGAQPSSQFPFQKYNFENRCHKVRKYRYQSLLELFNFTQFLYFVLNVLSGIIDYYHHLYQIWMNTSVTLPNDLRLYENQNISRNH